MGEVWRARDTKLNREVAVKILPDAFANDPDRMARFQREAQVLASLNHPNIAAIYGVEERALIIELVDGPTLAERIAEGPIPLAEALDIARQITDALEAAHESGIVHRDLKPANIKLTAGGRVKVLDFGLAKAISGEPVSGNPVNSPTLTMQGTVAGVILGTAAYMAPEQARGKTVDKRADIWAFGVILFEMLTGQRLFSGETVSDTLAAVLTKEPDWEHAPVEVRKLLQSCLEKDRKRRLRDIGDAWQLLQDPAGQAVASEGKGRAVVWMATAAAFAAAAIVLGAIHFGEKPAAAPLVRFSIAAPEKTTFNQWLALSPDGRHLAFTATGADSLMRIWIRSLDSVEARPVAGGDGSSTVTLFWSPDSRFIVFQSAGKVKKIDIAGGPAQSLCDAPPVMLGGSWNAAGDVVFGSNSGPLMRVSSSGGIAAPVTRIDRSRGETNHSDPIFLPDGKHFLYFRRSTDPANQGIYVGSLETTPDAQNPHRIQAVDYSPAYSPAPSGSSIGHLLLLREDSLLALPFNQRRLEIAGEAVPIAAHVGTSITRAFFSVSGNGVLAYRGGGGPTTELRWYDRAGRVLQLATPSAAEYQDVAISPDGTRVAYNRLINGLRQMWILDVPRAVQTRFTFVPEGLRSPSWSPDGHHLVFSGLSTGNIYIQDVNNIGNAQAVYRAEGPIAMDQWSPDGRFLLYTQITKSFDIWALTNPLSGGERKAIAVANSEFSEMHGQVSPDSRWVAYDSNESDRAEIYLRPFPPGDGRAGKWLISSNGGQQPRWRGDGKELFYLGPDRTMMAVDVKADPVFQSAAPHALFTAAAVNANSVMFQYDVTRDGKR